VEEEQDRIAAVFAADLNPLRDATDHDLFANLDAVRCVDFQFALDLVTADFEHTGGDTGCHCDGGEDVKGGFDYHGGNLLVFFIVI